MINTCAIVLAAGEGTRMKTHMPKVLSPVLFKPMLKWVLDSLNKSEIPSICVVTGYKSECVIDYLKTLPFSCTTVIQHERKGTAHAVMTAQEFLNQNIEKDILILNGDAPFIDEKTIKNAYDQHISQKNAVTVISAKVENPFGYGRIVRDPTSGAISAIIEQKDADEKVKLINEVNSGAYWFNVRALFEVLNKIDNHNAQGEFYLPDTIKLLLSEKHNVNAYISESKTAILGANSQRELQNLNTIARDLVLDKLMSNGVEIPCSDGIIITDEVLIGCNTRILPGTIITGKTVIGSGCTIGPNSRIDSCLIGNDIILNSVTCTGSTILSNEPIKPYSVLIGTKFV